MFHTNIHFLGYQRQDSVICAQKYTFFLLIMLYKHTISANWTALKLTCIFQCHEFHVQINVLYTHTHIEVLPHPDLIA